MSVGNQLKEMAENVVTKGATTADPMQKTPDYVPGHGQIEDLGGPSPDNYKPDDDSAKLKTPSAVVAKPPGKPGAKADPMPKAPDYAPGKGGADSYSTGSGKAKTKVEETEVEGDVVEEEKIDSTGDINIDVTDDINAMFNGEELSEEFKGKAATIFEAAVRAKVNELAESIEKQYADAAAEEVTEFKTELTERIDNYLEYVANEWFNSNQLAVENGLKAEMSESFLKGMKTLFEDHYVSIPEDKYDVLEAMSVKLDEMETKLNEQIEANVTLHSKLSESTKAEIVTELSRGLAESQKDKLASLAEGVEFESEKQFTEKLTTIKESYFSNGTTTQISDQAEEPQLDKGNSETMSAYIRALGKYSGK